MTALAIVAKEIARIVYHVLKEQTDFNGRFKGKVLTRTKLDVHPHYLRLRPLVGTDPPSSVDPPAF